ncbi:MAG TPA: hypothetical protein PL187_14590, partial [Caldilinea sp.]|nr:hypothetical protein [Caldilinea sp.]
WLPPSSLSSALRWQLGLLKTLNEQNQIAGLLSMRCSCQTISDLPTDVQESISDLFHFAFTLLTPLGIRDVHYQAIYSATKYHVCPFCGCEYFDAPKSRREALDHYLPESEYPFAAVNLYNLVPMGNKCNSRYKIAQDILWGKGGMRRKAFNPYNHSVVQISLDDSEPFAGKNGQIPRWVIGFEPDCDEVSTWNDVFEIRDRYVRDVLDDSFKSWLDDFANWHCSVLAPSAPNDISELTDSLERYFGYLVEYGFKDRVFLKAATFRMIQKQCQLGNQRLINLINRTVLGRLSQKALISSNSDRDAATVRSL